MCLPEDPVEGCGRIGCRDCSKEMLKKTFCNSAADEVHACMIALHPDCGLTCRYVTLQNCEESDCMEFKGGAKCAEFGWNTWCTDNDCAVCVSGPGSSYCDGDDLYACTSVPVLPEHCPGAGCDCDEICWSELLTSCEHGCVQEDGIPARCAG
jgi:hypothetical protein